MLPGTHCSCTWAPQPLCGPGSAASSTCPYPALASPVRAVCSLSAWLRWAGHVTLMRRLRQLLDLKGNAIRTIHLSVTAKIIMLRPRPRHCCSWPCMGRITHTTTPTADYVSNSSQSVNHVCVLPARPHPSNEYERCRTSCIP